MPSRGGKTSRNAEKHPTQQDEQERDDISGGHNGANLRQRQPRERNESYLKIIRTLPCVRCGLDPCGEAAHLRLTEDGKVNPGIGQKPSDQFATPLCRDCHSLQHSMGERRFWQQETAVERPVQFTRELFRLRDNEDAMRAYVFGHIDESLWI